MQASTNNNIRSKVSQRYVEDDWGDEEFANDLLRDYDPLEDVPPERPEDYDDGMSDEEFANILLKDYNHAEDVPPERPEEGDR